MRIDHKVIQTLHIRNHECYLSVSFIHDIKHPSVQVQLGVFGLTCLRYVFIVNFSKQDPSHVVINLITCLSDDSLPMDTIHPESSMATPWESCEYHINLSDDGNWKHSWKSSGLLFEFYVNS